eukprot:scaffold624_cov150-Cylindrotheca_fusiformis.AAC.4
MKYTTIVQLFFPCLVTAKLGEYRLVDSRYRQSASQEPPIVKVGEEPATPLGRCEGDCDSDSDCGSGLKCYQRTENFKAVPGCSGGAQDSSFFDYCVRNSDNFPVIKKVGANPGVPLERCEGDCDSDSECASSDLFCFPRNDDVVVPGCRGGQSDDSKFDYCVRRVDAAPGVAPTVPTADPSPDPTPPPTPDPTPPPTPPPASTPTPPPTPPPASAPTPPPTPAPVSNGDLQLRITYDFPLGRCEGDCDDDPDCEDGLICFQRGANDPVPGCSGGSSDSSRTDYCIPENNPVPTPPPTPAPVSSGILPLRATYDFPLGRCEGDCDDDPDCEDGLICFQRGANDPVPGCSGGSSDRSRTDYCIPENNPVPTPPPTPAPVPAPTSPSQPGVLPLRYSTHFPLGRCVGDCDRDGDCQSGLYCFQRDAYESVPGCSGGSSDRSKVDYCIPRNSAPTPAPAPTPTSSRPPLLITQSFPLSLCEGDCDRDADCQSGLKCFQRNAGESVPGCSGGSRDNSRTDYCIPR